MGRYLWTYKEKGMFVAEACGFELLAAPVSLEGEYGFRVLRAYSAVTSSHITIGSGHCASLQKAIEAAEAIAEQFKTTH